MKILKKSLAVLLALTLLLSMAPFCIVASAEEDPLAGMDVQNVYVYDVKVPKSLGNGRYAIPEFTYQVTFTDGSTIVKSSLEGDPHLRVTHYQDMERWSLEGYNAMEVAYMIGSCGMSTTVNVKLHDGKFEISPENDGIYISWAPSSSLEEDGTLRLPETIAGRKVVGLYGAPSDMTKLVLPKTIKKIGESVFSWAGNLRYISVNAENPYFTAVDGVLYNKEKTKLICIPQKKAGKITIPATVKNLDALPGKIKASVSVASGSAYFCSAGGAVYNKAKTKLYHVNTTASGTFKIPNTVSNMAQFAFYGCNKLSKVELSKKATAIAYNTFENCSNLKSVKMPSGLKSIGTQAFMNCKKLTSITIPAGVKTIEDFAFSGCSSLKSVSLSKGLNTIAGCAFSECSALKNITLPSTLTSIGPCAFSNSGLTKVTIPNSVTSIDSDAFACCVSLKKVTIGSGLKEMGYHAFFGCDSLANITISSKNKYFSAKDGVIYNKDQSIAKFAPSAVGYGIKLSSKTTTLEYGVFHHNKKIKTISMPNSVTSIAYLGSGQLTSAQLPNKLKTISEWAFYGCDKMISITIPKSVKTIEGYAFVGCYKLKHVYYAGSKAEWNAINITEWGNEALTKATIHYNSKGCTHKYSAGADLSCNTCGYYNIEPTLKEIKGKWYYYNNGVKQTSFTGVVTINGKDRFIKKGVVSSLGQPKAKLTTTASGVKVSWGKVDGATSYQVYRSTYSGGKWSAYKAYKTTKSLSITDTSLKSGAKVRYTVYAKNGKFTSKFKTGVSTVYLAPRTAKVSKTSAGVKASWSKVSGAKGYTVYRRTYSNGKWGALKALKKTTNATYTDRSAKKGVKYQYVVRAYNGKAYSAIKYSASIKK